jgi:site-specific recombinase XerC
MLTAAGAIATDLRLSQEIAGHRSISSTLFYTRLTSVSDRLRVASKIVVPGLH